MTYQSNGFEVILADKNQSPYCGQERQIKTTDKAINYYRDKFGSHRFILYLGNVAVSALQVMIINQQAVATNVITVKDHRLKGYAKRVLAEAKLHFKIIRPSANQSPEGQKYVSKCY